MKEKLLHKSVRASTDVQNQSFTMMKSKLTVSNLAESHVLRYKLLSKRTSTEISKNFRLQVKR